MWILQIFYLPVQFLVATQVTLSMKGCRETQKLPAMPRGLLCAALGNWYCNCPAWQKAKEPTVEAAPDPLLARRSIATARCHNFDYKTLFYGEPWWISTVHLTLLFLVTFDNFCGALQGRVHTPWCMPSTWFELELKAWKERFRASAKRRQTSDASK